jgi:hypothetical protein
MDAVKFFSLDQAMGVAAFAQKWQIEYLSVKLQWQIFTCSNQALKKVFSLTKSAKLWNSSLMLHNSKR